jgi:hypothetical protein
VVPETTNLARRRLSSKRPRQSGLPLLSSIPKPLPPGKSRSNKGIACLQWLPTPTIAKKMMMRTMIAGV